ncbi:MAG: hypothetical protein M3032_12605, partial [Verrucomicrobiota bacterium]|nr:hypothetical protein [Verrucomicrobiota bacterium]
VLMSAFDRGPEPCARSLRSSSLSDSLAGFDRALPISQKTIKDCHPERTEAESKDLAKGVWTNE